MLVLEKPTPLSVMASDLQAKSVSFTDDYVRGPDLNIDGVFLPWLGWLDVCREVISIRQIIAMSRIAWISLSQG